MTVSAECYISLSLLLSISYTQVSDSTVHSTFTSSAMIMHLPSPTLPIRLLFGSILLNVLVQAYTPPADLHPAQVTSPPEDINNQVVERNDEKPIVNELLAGVPSGLRSRVDASNIPTSSEGCDTYHCVIVWEVSRIG